MAIPQGPNQRWSLDFVADSLACGRRFRILCVIDDFSRECLTTVVDTSFSEHRVVRDLDRIVEERGYFRIGVLARQKRRALIGFAVCRSVRCSVVNAQAAFFTTELALSVARSVLAAIVPVICSPASEASSAVSVLGFWLTSARLRAARMNRSICFCTKSL